MNEPSQREKLENLVKPLIGLRLTWSWPVLRASVHESWALTTDRESERQGRGWSHHEADSMFLSKL